METKVKESKEIRNISLYGEIVYQNPADEKNIVSSSVSCGTGGSSGGCGAGGCGGCSAF